MYPTETVYGLGAGAFSEEAVRKVYGSDVIINGGRCKYSMRTVRSGGYDERDGERRRGRYKSKNCDRNRNKKKRSML